MTPGSLKHPGRWLWIFLAIPIALGLMRLRFDVEIFNLLPTDIPAVRGLIIHQQQFANARELIITLEGNDPEKLENAARDLARHLRAKPDLVKSVLWEPPWLEHPEWSAELIAYLWFNQPRATFEQLRERLPPDRLTNIIASAREQLATSMSPGDIARLSYDPFGFTQLPEETSGAAPSFAQGQEGFSSPDGTFRLLFVEAQPELATFKDCDRWLTSIQRAVAEALGSAAEIKVAYTGRPAFVAEIAGQMQKDITLSVGGTAAIIAVLFWLAHRRVKPMLWLLTLLALILGSTLALGGLIFGAINVISMGFAAILLGLAVDYAVVHYQEALANPELTIPQIRHAIAPSIFWAAVTTISAFLVLNFGGLPGLAQLGSLVAVGVALAATIMIYEFLPPLFPERNHPVPPKTAVSPQVVSPRREDRSAAVSAKSPYPAKAGSIALIGLTAAVLILKGMPAIDPTAAPLRPRNSRAYDTLSQVQKLFTQEKEPLWVIVRGKTEQEVSDSLAHVQGVLQKAAASGMISGSTVPISLWPSPEAQQKNRSTALGLVSERAAFRMAALGGGFSTNSLGLTDTVLDTWEMLARASGSAWPQNPMSRWILDKFAARTPTNLFALALVTLATNAEVSVYKQRLRALSSDLNSSNSWLTGWELLGDSIFDRVKHNMWKVVVLMVCLVGLSLWFAFRRPVEIALSVSVLLVSGFTLLAMMRLLGWSWNLLNLMAIPLILGTGVDYSLFMLLGLRRFGGDIHLAYRSVGRALLLCGGTAVAGFGSLSLSSNAGMSSLGQVCATGIACNMLLAIFVLPHWWQSLSSRPTPDAANDLRPRTPSSFYRAGFWRIGLFLGRLLPRSVAVLASKLVMELYWWLARARRDVVIENLLPIMGDRKHARMSAHRLFRNFGVKLVDLWRYEAGLNIEPVLGHAANWERIIDAIAQKRGVLLLTPHLGNWEFGSPFLTRKGIDLQVITLAEPGKNFTELRQAARTRRQIQTLVIGADPFGFLAVIKRLEAGAVVALLVDRPPLASAVRATLFGRPFLASIAAAELARASGCILLPAYSLLSGGKYEANVLPAIDYDRAALRNRSVRAELTQRIIDAFAPVIAEDADQWYHFVPVWESGERPKTGDPNS